MSFLVPGVNSSVEASKKLSRKNVEFLFVARKEVPKELLWIPSKRVTKDYLDRMVPGVNHQGLVLKIKDFPYREEDAAFSMEKLLFLDGVESPVNLGTISRTAAFFGMDGILLPKRRSARVTPLAAKVSEGGVFHLDFIKVKSPTSFLRALKEEGFTLIGAVESGGVNPRELKDVERFVLMLGGEDTGLRSVRAGLADILVTIPGSGRIGSLNVSCAACIIIFHLAAKKP